MVLFGFGEMANIEQTDFNHNIKKEKIYIYLYKVSQQKRKKKSWINETVTAGKSRSMIS